MVARPGTQLGTYQILSILGRGGMGEVWRARDTTLGREVAVKTLPEAFAQDAHRLARFEREAKLLAALNHPNIAAIYGLEQSDETPFLVLELVEGQTLYDRLYGQADAERSGPGAIEEEPRGPIPVDRALALALEIADALEAAHEKGVIHRDLKPANIKITPEGRVKVLDFGLAKALKGEAAASDPSAAPTLSLEATSPGVLLGTAAYMAPEQAKGRAVDRRTDVWAFGCVLYEMLCQRRTFEGEDVTDTLAAVLRSDPDWDALPLETPPAIRNFLRWCLVKEPRDRCPDIAVARKVLREALAEPAAPRAPASVPALRPWQRPEVFGATLAVAIFGVLAAIGIWVIGQLAGPIEAPRDVARFALMLPEGSRSSPGQRHGVALSPLGTHIAYVADERLYLRSMGQLEAEPIRGAEADVIGTGPFFSPDGQWIGFWQGAQLKKIALDGGVPVTLCAAPQQMFGGSWGPDGTILFAQGPAGIWRVSAQGGTPEVIASVEEGQRAHGPQMLPGGDAILFTLLTGTSSGGDQAQVVAQSLATGERKVLVDGGTNGRYLPTGHLVYVSGGTLLGVPLDLQRLEAVGGPVPLVENLAVDPVQAGAAHFSVSNDGSLVYLPGSAGDADRSLVWVDRQGREQPLPTPQRTYGWVRLSPDGTRVALHVQEPSNTDVWIYDLSHGTSTRLTFGTASDRFPVWASDGQRIAYTSGSNVVSRLADGTGEAERLTTGLNAPRPFDWSRDGQTLVLDWIGSGAVSVIGTLQLAPERGVRPLIDGRVNMWEPALSPDGRWIAYVSFRTEQMEVYVQPFPDVERGRWQVSTNGGANPVWSPDGQELFYVDLDGALTAVPVDAGASFRAHTPERLFEGDYYWGGGILDGRPFDVAPDGQRFLLLKNAESTSTPQLILVQNWFEELTARVRRS